MDQRAELGRGGGIGIPPALAFGRDGLLKFPIRQIRRQSKTYQFIDRAVHGQRPDSFFILRQQAVLAAP